MCIKSLTLLAKTSLGKKKMKGKLGSPRRGVDVPPGTTVMTLKNTKSQSRENGGAMQIGGTTPPLQDISKPQLLPLSRRARRPSSPSPVDIWEAGNNNGMERATAAADDGDDESSSNGVDTSSYFHNAIVQILVNILIGSILIYACG